jgi:DNA invertase Pin-like site-specific DNA recombinase
MQARLELAQRNLVDARVKTGKAQTEQMFSGLSLKADAGAGFKSIGEPWADTTTSAGRVMLTVLSRIAEFERDLILQADQRGSDARHGRGYEVRSQTEADPGEALKRMAAGEMLREIAPSYNVDHSTICRLKARYAVEA